MHTKPSRICSLLSVLVLSLTAIGLVHAQPGPPEGGGTGGTNGIPEAPTDGRIYGRQGSTTSWQAVLASGSGIPGDVLMYKQTNVLGNFSPELTWVPVATNQVPSTHREVFLLGGGTLSNALTEPIQPGFFVGQSLFIYGGSTLAYTLGSRPTLVLKQPYRTIGYQAGSMDYLTLRWDGVLWREILADDWYHSPIAITNTVVGVPDLFTLTNSVIGRDKVWVGKTNELVHRLFQLVPIGNTLAVPTNDLRGVPTAGPATITISNNVIICTQNATPQSTFGVNNNTGTANGQTYTMYAWISANEETQLSTTTSTWSAFTTNTSLAIGPTPQLKSITMTASSSVAFRWFRVGTPDAAETLLVSNWRYNVGGYQPQPDGLTLFPSATPGYGWQEVTLAPATEAGMDSTIARVYVTNDFILIPTSTHQVYATATGASYSMNAAEVVEDGSVGGQELILLNDAQYVFGPTHAPFYLYFANDLVGGDGLGTNIQFPLGSDFMELQSGQFWILDWNASVQLWIWREQGAHVALLPAPWLPPDGNGVQILPAAIKDALVRELLPHLLTNYARLFPNGPTPSAPGTPANPIVVP